MKFENGGSQELRRSIVIDVQVSNIHTGWYGSSTQEPETQSDQAAQS